MSVELLHVVKKKKGWDILTICLSTAPIIGQHFVMEIRKVLKSVGSCLFSQFDSDKSLQKWFVKNRSEANSTASVNWIHNELRNVLRCFLKSARSSLLWSVSVRTSRGICGFSLLFLFCANRSDSPRWARCHFTWPPAGFQPVGCSSW